VDFETFPNALRQCAVMGNTGRNDLCLPQLACHIPTILLILITQQQCRVHAHTHTRHSPWSCAVYVTIQIVI